ncbi:hypothetical protein K458DRAFT_373229 [Lentithecium fluviatile CBS 122367]|uniref:Wax synthase domain-containing protein n=1 Tax=Lentithecium fluviatile CBS 122367 TaxID=1168545 RepID=A0A6G1IR20_9PLEO|nr:hypothetical protein K458DRAFT_373229 [Lentithecium fluviatile CBS 122367]
MIPSNTWPHTHQELVRHYHHEFDKNIASGKYQPLVFPEAFLGALVVIIYLLIPHQNRSWLKMARHAVFAFYVAHTTYLIRNVRAKNVAAALGIGLISAWGGMYFLAILVCYDAQTDFQRIERTEGVFGSDEEGSRKESEEEATSTEEKSNGVKEVQKGTSNGTIPTEHLGPSKRHGEYAWQPFPLTPFIERLDWVLDVFGNFRGAGWNWRIIAAPPPPKAIQDQLYRNSPNPPKHTFRKHHSQTTIYPTRRALLIANLKTFIIGYLMLDLLKTIVIHDPYYWGLVDRAPAPYLPSVITANPIVLHVVRLTVSQFAVKYALQTIFSLAPLFFSGILGPSFLGARAEPWIYPETWGSYVHVLDKGLAGWWSAWWHQTFRFAFDAPSRRIIEVTGMNPKAPAAKFLQLVVAFGLSGVLHASGSVTCHGATRPLLGPMRFFLLQSVVVFAESNLTSLVHKTGIQNRVPRWLKRSFTFFYVHFWFYHTGHLLCEDFAKGGVWLFEPVPFSLFRGLGLGTEGDGWWCYGDWGLRWHSGDRWWKSGIAL